MTTASASITSDAAVTPRVLLRTTAGTIEAMDAKGDLVAVYIDRGLASTIELYRLGRRVGRWPAACGDPGVESIAIGGGGVGWVCILSGSSFASATLRVDVPGRRKPALEVRTGWARHAPITVAGDGQLLVYNMPNRDLMMYDGNRQRRLARNAGPPVTMDGLTVTFEPDSDPVATGPATTLTPDGRRWKLPDPPIPCGCALTGSTLVTLDDTFPTMSVYDVRVRRRTARWRTTPANDFDPSLSADRQHAAYLGASGPRVVDLTSGRDVPVQLRYPGAGPARDASDARAHAALTEAGLFYSYNDAAEEGWVVFVPSRLLRR